MCPRSKIQLKELKEGRRLEILEAALEVFAKSGYNGATINMIAEKASISKGLLYNYFESKEMLLDSLLRFGLEKAADFMKSADIPKPTDKASFASGLKAMVQLLGTGNDFWRLYCMVILQKNMAEKFEKEAGSFLRQYLLVYAAYFKKNGSADPKAEAMLLGSILDGVMFDMMVMPHEYPLEDVLNLIIKKFA